MHVLVLGSGAGGGYPQWNCNCRYCHGVRQGTLTAQPRTQSSIAVSDDGERWLIINASPDIGQQLKNNAQLWPSSGVRSTPICGVLLTDAQIDHVTGLLSLREGCPLDLWATPNVQSELSTSFPLLTVLSHWSGGFRLHVLPDSESIHFSIPALPNLDWQVVPLISNAPPYSPRRDRPAAGDNIGLFVTDQRSGRSLFYAPGLGVITPAVKAFMEKASCVLVDGTCWEDNEMESVGCNKRARDMGHLPLNGPDGMIEHLRALTGARKILIHINNTNPVLDADSAQRQILNQLEIEVAHDGMVIAL